MKETLPNIERSNYPTFVDEAIDEGLSLLGESGKKATYYYLEHDHNIKRGEVSNKAQVFSDALDKMFGPGAVFIKALIIKRIYQKSGNLPPEGFNPSDFVKYVTIGL